MMRSTRSVSNKSLSETTDSSLTKEEMEILRQQMNEKEKQLREQAESLAIRETEFQEQRQQESSRESHTLNELINNLHRDLNSFKDLPRQINYLREQIDSLQILVQPTASPSPQQTPHTAYTPPNSPASVEHSPIRLKDIADSIPKYDGQRMSVFHFSKTCERASDFIPLHQESYLIQLIISKLVGHAYTAIEGSQFNSVKDLTLKLKLIFGPNKSLNQYRGELANAYMKPNETIFDFIARIKELKEALIDGHSEIHRLDDWTLDNINADVLASFINGLPLELLIRVKIEGFQNLDDAFLKAIQMSKTLDSEALRRRSSYSNKSQNNPLQRQDIPYPRPFEQRPFTPKPPAQILRRLPNPFIKPLVPGQPGPNIPIINFCRYCKSDGHAINNCAKLQYRNSMQNQAGSSGQAPAPSKQVQGNERSSPVFGDIRRDAATKPGYRAVHFQENPIPTP